MTIERALIVDDRASMYGRKEVIFGEKAEFVHVTDHDDFLARVNMDPVTGEVDKDELRELIAPYRVVIVDALCEPRYDDFETGRRPRSIAAGLDIVHALRQVTGHRPVVVAYSRHMEYPEVALPFWEARHIVRARFAADALLAMEDDDGEPVLRRVLRGDYRGALGDPTEADWVDLGVGPKSRLMPLVNALRSRDDTWMKVWADTVPDGVQLSTVMKAIGRAAGKHLDEDGPKTATDALRVVRKITGLNPRQQQRR